MNYRRLLVVLLFTPITGLFLFMFVTSPLAIVLALLSELLLELEPDEDNLLILLLLTVVFAIIGAFFLNRAIYDSVSKPASHTEGGSVNLSGSLIAKSLLYGALGSIAPYFLVVLAGIIIGSWDPESASAIGEVVGILGTLACLPTIFMGAIMGTLFVWLVVRFERPDRIFLKIANSSDSRWIFLVGFLAGFLAGPILGMLAFLALAWSGAL